MEDFSKIDFPNLKEYLSDLELLDKMNFDGHLHQEIYDAYFDLARTLPMGYGIFTPKKFSKLTFYRVRLNLKHEEHNLTSIATYAFPPNFSCTKNGRANLAGQSVFYCSNSPDAAILECQPKVGDTGSLSVWKSKAENNIKFGICLPLDLPEENDFNLMAIDIFNHMLKAKPKIPANRIEHFKALHELLNKKFTTENEPYHLTSIISHEMLFGDSYKDFIIYASTKSKLNLCNMAFHPKSVIENLYLEKVIRFRISKIENENVIFNLGKVGFPYKNTFLWEECSKEEENLFVKVKPAGNRR